MCSLFFFLLTLGCSPSKPEILDIDATEVQAIQVGLGMNTGILPDRLESEDSEDEEVIQKIIEWFNSSDYQGESQKADEQPMTSMGIGNTLRIFLGNGEIVCVYPGRESLIVSSEGNSDKFKIYDEPLMRWLTSGWEEDIGQSTPTS